VGQQDILDFLCDHPDEWFTATEVRQGVGVSVNPSRCLRALRVNADVIWKEYDVGYKGKRGYMYKHRGKE